MRRLRDVVRGQRERGATAIVVALLMTAILGCTGLAVDLGASYAKHTQLQNGADAAALALAQEYAVDGCTPDGEMATTWVAANINHNAGGAHGTASCPESNQVRVVAETTVDHWFMPVVGKDSSDLSADATVEWGAPVAGAGFPITFSQCVFDSAGAQAGEYVEVWMPKKNDKDPNCSAKDYPAGGFGWLNSDDCQADYVVLQPDGSALIGGDTGNADKTGCDWGDQVPSDVLVPIFSHDNGVNGSGHGFYVYKFAAFELVGITIHTGNRHGFTSSTQCHSKNQPFWAHKTCVYGRFVEYVSVDDAFKLGPPQPGDKTLIVRLID